jgi:tetratricopeptide (TPR) repeat protein
MPTRALLVCLVAMSGCGPALTIRRLAAPTTALAASKIELKIINHGSDNVAGTDERVTDAMVKSASQHLELAGYTVCSPSPCGDGVLELTITESSFVLQAQQESPQAAAMKAQLEATMAAYGFSSAGAVWTSSNDIVKAKLDLVAQLTLPGGKVTFKRDAHRQLDDRGKAPSTVMKESLEVVSKELFEPLRRNTPLAQVPLEGGGPLNRGVELLHEKKFVEAASYFAELSKSQPELDGAFYDLGFALEAQSAWEPALAAYREAAQRAPGKAHYAKAVSAAESALKSGE